MTIYRQGDIVIVPLPFTDLSSTKRRPALVLSANWYNRARREYILAAITSTVHRSLESDQILIHGAHIAQSGLRNESVINAGKIFTIHQGLIIKRVGEIPGALLQQAITKLQECFGAVAR